MKYLVLRRFWSYGKLLLKGTVHDESEIRHPRLKLSEGVIIPAVSSSEVPREPGDDENLSQVPEETSEGEDTTSEKSEETVETAEPAKKPLFRL